MDSGYYTFRVNTQGVVHTNRSWPAWWLSEDTFQVPRKVAKAAASDASTKKAEAVRAGQRLADARNALGYSQKYVCHLIGDVFQPSRLANYEQGTRMLGVTEAELLAPVLKTVPGYLLGVLDERQRDLLMLPQGVQNAMLMAAGAFKDPPVIQFPNKEPSEIRPKAPVLPARLQRR